ncbi:MAG TPA: GTP cyclohydrolase II [Ktedonobacteraceae bacterium]|jgi:3,4-dihydroxy 2-butanone 4-phosphate synthase/GTP cyclohydrolase II|nr:GTP cyclohydrolase II [Ktedonobacteraceae bacterium]
MEYSTKDTQLTIPEATATLRQGHPLLITSHSGGVLCQAAQFVDHETISRFQTLSGSTIYAVLASERYDTLRLPMPANDWRTKIASTITVSLDFAHEALTHETLSTLTLRALIDPLTRADDLSSPGPIVPLRIQPGGVLARQDYPEGVIELLSIAGLEPGAVMSELLTQKAIAQIEQTNIAQISLDAIVAYRQTHQVSFISEVILPTALATFRLRHYQEIASRQPYLALLLGDLQASQQAPLLRLHSACLTGDIFGSQRCDCQAQLHAALAAIANEGRGLLLYLPQEGRGIGISAKLQAYVLQEQGYDTLEANTRLGYPVDARDYSSAVEILHELGLSHVRLLTNNPEKVQALQRGNFTVERVALETTPTEDNLTYLQTKVLRMGHQLEHLLDQDHLHALHL